MFYDVLEGLIESEGMLESVSRLIEQKSLEPERSLLEVPADVFVFFVSIFESLEESVSFTTEVQIVDDKGFLEILS